ncbi:SDR family NAD(P)-dependent oxidoreductase [Kribbella sp. NPDC056861]|uniref:SDR family NAD(P)-dependent oxidoreductase n=1 Tax=Kribbella sp. NPDC056861 TaxID=3154857 RepID=UPI00341A9A5A
MLEHELNRPATTAEIADYLDVSTSEVDEARAARGCFRVLSLDDPSSSDGNGSALDLASSLAAETDRDVAQFETLDQMAPFLDGLDARTRRILQATFDRFQIQLKAAAVHCLTSLPAFSLLLSRGSFRGLKGCGAGYQLSMPTRPLALVTGASSGIGPELARRFALHGYDLVIAAEDSKIEAAATELRVAGPETVQVEALKLDLSQTKGVQLLYSALNGRVPDAIALNAGFGLGGSFAENDLSVELTMIDLNVRSTLSPPRHAARHRGRTRAAPPCGRP